MIKTTKHIKHAVSFIIPALLLSVSDRAVIQADNDKNIYSCSGYSVEVPHGYETDSETLQDFTSFYNDNVTIGIRLTSNAAGENVATFTETKINEIITDTLSSLTAQAGEGITEKAHAIQSFSNNAYPALYIAFTGKTELDDSVYMEEYIITTESFKYTLVFSADNKSLLENDDVMTLKKSFTTTEEPLRKAARSDENTLKYILAACSFFVILSLVVTILYIRNKHAKSPHGTHTH